MAVTLSEVFDFKAPHHPVVLGPPKEYGKIPDDENHTKSVPNLIHGRKHRELIAKKKSQTKSTKQIDMHTQKRTAHKT